MSPKFSEFSLWMCPHKARPMSIFCHGFNKNVTAVQCNLAVSWRDVKKEIQVSRWCSPSFCFNVKSHVHKNVQASLMFFWKVSKRNGCLLLRTEIVCSSVLIESHPGKFYNSVLLFTPHVSMDSQNQQCSKRKSLNRK